ncbi:hypothetical protein ACFLYD_06975 [Chloroflexota bacterium]
MCSQESDLARLREAATRLGRDADGDIRIIISHRRTADRLRRAHGLGLETKVSGGPSWDGTREEIQAYLVALNRYVDRYHRLLDYPEESEQDGTQPGDLRVDHEVIEESPEAGPRRASVRLQQIEGNEHSHDEVAPEAASVKAPTKPPPPALRPAEPRQDASRDEWFDWYHACRKSGFKATLADIADKSGFALSTIKQAHREYKRARAID